jgi:DNA-binding transcriptional ArsR family regulator
MSDIGPPGYALLEAIDIDSPGRMRALGDPVRALIADLVLEQAMTVTELAERIGRARGTIAHHVDVLCAAGLLQVVRTRKVRAIEERFYGRTARTYMLPSHPEGQLPFAVDALHEWDRQRHDAEDIGGFTLRHARIPAERATEFWHRLEALTLEFTGARRGGDVEYAMYAAVFPTNRPVAPAPRKKARRAS